MEAIRFCSWRLKLTPFDEIFCMVTHISKSYFWSPNLETYYKWNIPNSKNASRKNNFQGFQGLSKSIADMETKLCMHLAKFKTQLCAKGFLKWIVFSNKTKDTSCLQKKTFLGFFWWFRVLLFLLLKIIRLKNTFVESCI